MALIHDVASLLHSRYCQVRHGDVPGQCRWYSEAKLPLPWAEWAHETWLSEAGFMVTELQNMVQ